MTAHRKEVPEPVTASKNQSTRRANSNGPALGVRECLVKFRGFMLPAQPYPITKTGADRLPKWLGEALRILVRGTDNPQRVLSKKSATLPFSAYHHQGTALKICFQQALGHTPSSAGSEHLSLGCPRTLWRRFPENVPSVHKFISGTSQMGMSSQHRGSVRKRRI